MENLYLGIDIGGTNTKFGFVTKAGKVLSSHKIPTDSHIPFADYTAKLVEAVNLEFSLYSDKYVLNALGVGAPNGNGKNGKVENPPNLGWEVIELEKEFSKAFGIPAKLENDANIAAVGEKQFGRAKSLENFVVITLGTGVGVGTYIYGSLYLGSHGVGSESGHMTVIPNGRQCNCGGIGHLECYASAPGIEKTAKELLGIELTFPQINDRFHLGDKDIIKVIKKTADILALGLSQMGSLLTPQEFILSGGVCVLGENFRFMIEDKFIEYTYPPFRGHTQISISTISTEFGAILGAASLVM